MAREPAVKRVLLRDYYISGKERQDQDRKIQYGFSEWKKLKKGEEIELKINFNGFAEINNKD